MYEDGLAVGDAAVPGRFCFASGLAVGAAVCWDLK